MGCESSRCHLLWRFDHNWGESLCTPLYRLLTRWWIWLWMGKSISQLSALVVFKIGSYMHLNNVYETQVLSGPGSSGWFSVGSIRTDMNMSEWLKANDIRIYSKIWYLSIFVKKFGYNTIIFFRFMRFWIWKQSGLQVCKVFILPVRQKFPTSCK